jgi:hypothetical protein
MKVPDPEGVPRSDVSIGPVGAGQQVTEYLEARHRCPHGGQSRGKKGSHTVTLQTLLGHLKIDSSRWSHCPCQPDQEKTFSPVAEWLSDRSLDRLYWEIKWGSQISFALAAELLKDRLPVAETGNVASIRHHLHRVAERAEAALGNEPVSFMPRGSPQNRP